MQEALILDRSRLKGMIQRDSHTVMFRFYRLYLDQLRSFVAFTERLRLPDDRFELVQQVHKHKSAAKVVGADRLVNELERIESCILSEKDEPKLDLGDVIAICRVTVSQVEEIVNYKVSA